METEECVKEEIKEESFKNFVIRIDKDKLAEVMEFTSLVDEVVVKMKEDGLHILHMDSSQIAEVRVDIPKEQLLEYTINTPEINVGLDRNNIKQILKVIDDGDVTLRRDNTDLEHLFIVTADSEFSVPSLNIDETITKEPAFDTDYEITIPAKDLLNRIKEVELFGTHVTFETDGIDFYWKHDDEYKTKFKGFSLVALHPKKLESTMTDSMQIARAAYPLVFLKDILTGVRKYLVKLYFKTNSPIKIVVVKDGINVLYYLAPRVESV